MPRVRPPDFLDRLATAGTRVFARKGLKRARMSDVAREMGVSQGTLYNYVQSKEALFYLLLERGVGGGERRPPASLPVRTPPRRAMLRRLEGAIARDFALPRLDAALGRRRVNDPSAELEGILYELYECTERTRDGATVLERSALELPDLFEVFFLKARRGLLERLTRYVASRVELGAFRPLPDPGAAARLIVETVTHFARHRHGDPDPTPMSEDAARETVVQMLRDALLAPGGRRP